VEVSHTDLSEVTGMVLVDVGPVVVLTTGHTTTTGMLAVLSCEELEYGRASARVRCTYRHVRVRRKRDRGACGSLTISAMMISDAHCWYSMLALTEGILSTVGCG
jgi:hypothetical protein